MEKIQGYFVGYNTLKSKEKQTNYYVIEVLIQDVQEFSVTSTIKRIFLDNKDYVKFLEKHKPFDNITLSCVVNKRTDKVYYNISE